MNFRLTHPLDEHYSELMSWFSTEEELNLWSGPNFTYPFDLTTFKRDLKGETLKSYSLITHEGDFLAFGQYYLRLERCHLGRLVVNPHFRGQGIAAYLIDKLSDLGKSALNTNSCSLFVLAQNVSAIKAYTKLGFTRVEYPQTMPLANCLYMVKI